MQVLGVVAPGLWLVAPQAVARAPPIPACWLHGAALSLLVAGASFHLLAASAQVLQTLQWQETEGQKSHGNPPHLGAPLAGDDIKGHHSSRHGKGCTATMCVFQSVPAPVSQLFLQLKCAAQSP